MTNPPRDLAARRIVRAMPPTMADLPPPVPGLEALSAAGPFQGVPGPRPRTRSLPQAAQLRLIRPRRGQRSAGGSISTMPPTIGPDDARTRLVAERERVVAGLDATRIIAPDTMTYGSQAAAASQVFEQQRDLALRDKDTQHLEAVDAALARVAAGTYGRCTSCGGVIADERLDALPWAALCIDCQRTAGRRR